MQWIKVYIVLCKWFMAGRTQGQHFFIYLFSRGESTFTPQEEGKRLQPDEALPPNVTCTEGGSSTHHEMKWKEKKSCIFLYHAEKEQHSWHKFRSKPKKKENAIVKEIKKYRHKSNTLIFYRINLQLSRKIKKSVTCTRLVEPNSSIESANTTRKTRLIQKVT